MEKIERIRDNEVLIDGIKYIKDEPEPEFKAGQWAGFRTYDGKIFPFLIHHFNGHVVYGQDFKNKYDIYKIVYQTDKHNLISVTPEEIESHLRKICDEKYIGKRVKCLNGYECDKISKENAIVPYRESDDTYWMRADNGLNICVYKQGKFAEIIPDKKKPPKTREEFEIFLDEYFYGEWNKDDFLDQYEIR